MANPTIMGVNWPDAARGSAATLSPKARKRFPLVVLSVRCARRIASAATRRSPRMRVRSLAPAAAPAPVFGLGRGSAVASALVSRVLPSTIAPPHPRPESSCDLRSCPRRHRSTRLVDVGLGRLGARSWRGQWPVGTGRYWSALVGGGSVGTGRFPCATPPRSCHGLWLRRAATQGTRRVVITARLDGRTALEGGRIIPRPVRGGRRRQGSLRQPYAGVCGQWCPRGRQPPAGSAERDASVGAFRGARRPGTALWRPVRRVLPMCGRIARNADSVVRQAPRWANGKCGTACLAEVVRGAGLRYASDRDECHPAVGLFMGTPAKIIREV